jgi:hypothetical protein
VLAAEEVVLRTRENLEGCDGKRGRGGGGHGGGLGDVVGELGLKLVKLYYRRDQAFE